LPVSIFGTVLIAYHSVLTENSGPIDTPMLKEADDMRGAVTDFSWLPLGRRGRKEEVPPLMEFLITDASSFMTGAAIPIDGGWDC
jgi:NAD(P)-dependent dehydrogenase (short-subunit alcohol dehydrogenase family)